MFTRRLLIGYVDNFQLGKSISILGSTVDQNHDFAYWVEFLVK